MLKKISYQVCFVVLVSFSQAFTTVTAANSAMDSYAEFSKDLKFVCQLYSKWMQHKCATLKEPINKMVQLYYMCPLQDDYYFNKLANESLTAVRLALIAQAEKLANDFDKQLEQLKANIGDKGYFYSWHDKDTSWLNEGISPEEKQKFIELVRLKPQAIALLCHLAELDYRYGSIDVAQIFQDLLSGKNDILCNLDRIELTKKVAGRNALHCKLFTYLVGCQTLDDIIKRDMACLRVLLSKGKTSYANLDILVDSTLELYPDFDLSERDLLGTCCRPLSNMDVFAHQI